MARNSIARTVVETFAEVKYIDENNDTHKATVHLWGDYDEETAQSACVRKLRIKRLMVQKVHHKSFYGRMPMKEFAKYCEKSNEKEW